MTLYHITNGFFHDYMLADWEDYLDAIKEEDTIIDITIEEYGKMFPQPPMTIYDLGGSSYLANWVDPPIDIELYDRNETDAQNITEIKISEEPPVSGYLSCKAKYV